MSNFTPQEIEYLQSQRLGRMATVDTKGDLHVAFRSQSLYQARVRMSGPTLTLILPQHVRGDDICCPRRAVERDYAWDAAKKTFTRRATRTVTTGATFR